MGSYSQTVASLAVTTTANKVNAIQIGSGQTLTVTGGAMANLFNVGGGTATGVKTNLTVTGSGTLTVYGPTQNMVAPR